MFRKKKNEKWISFYEIEFEVNWNNEKSWIPRESGVANCIKLNVNNSSLVFFNGLKWKWK